MSQDKVKKNVETQKAGTEKRESAEPPVCTVDNPTECPSVQPVTLSYAGHAVLEGPVRKVA